MLIIVRMHPVRKKLIWNLLGQLLRVKAQSSNLKRIERLPIGSNISVPMPQISRPGKIESSFLFFFIQELSV